MQLNITAALITALISAVLGFGLAFYIQRILNSRMQKKSQRLLVYIAMISFGIGLTAFLNELIGFPLQGLQIRHEKLVGYVIFNMLLIPIILLVLAKLIGLKVKAGDIDLKTQNSEHVPIVINSSKISPLNSFQEHTLDLEPTLDSWNEALNEYGSEQRNNGLWAKLFADNAGVESMTKAQYLRIRASEISMHNSKKQAELSMEKFTNSTNELCIKNNALEQLQIDFSYPVYKLANGNYAINYAENFKIYSSLVHLYNAIDVFKRLDNFSPSGLIGVYQRK
jgi:hypothetical protein